ncbi:recombination directionality factor [Knoellia sp. LjRoot47]|uniref:recombination directionality factor n=1 Tax=Knoellia sp. LjRoot47 TaxID=3342330 RepID=UPI003ECFF931
MPISPIVLQRRHAELGRIRLGQKVPTQRGGSRPEKLDRFRFTSGDERLITDIATLYGGEARSWDNSGKAEFEVITDAKSIPVIVVKGGFSQWMETWSGGGCTHRCDGINNALTGGLCDDNDPAHKNAKATTRLSVMLRDVESLGVWRLESHGWNAAAELPAVAELAMHVGDLVPALLHLSERRAIKDGKTSRFVVPVLDLAVSKQRLVEIVSGVAAGAQQIGGTAPLAIEAGGAGLTDEEIDEIADAATTDQLNTLWRRLGEAGRLTDDAKQRIAAAAAEIKAATETPEAGDAPLPPAAAPASGPTAERDALQMQVLAQAAERGMTSDEVIADLEQEFAQPVDDLTPEQLRQYLAKERAA